ncbi:uncharacterized protein LOC129751109 isoform X7 [Uranotaenia lowii]|uniref:uncharacterized protein LOC129751109 isoform X7 n=1 Tax=Uranotaenia lowii TaxID=190385 RepID=UPI00247A6F61|nr:uncharacterized protein LOC129751109 isoform X7 [Uranotaenia lowii]
MGLLEYISLIDFLATSATISTVLQFLTGLFINMQEIHKKEVNWRHLGTAVYFWFSVDARWTFWLVVAGISTTFGAAVPTGYNIGVINAPANGGGHMQYGDKGSRETGVVEVFELFEYDRFNFISKIDSLRSTIFFFVAFK